MILHGWKNDNAKTAELLDTNFDATFWAGAKKSVMYDTLSGI